MLNRIELSAVLNTVATKVYICIYITIERPTTIAQLENSFGLVEQSFGQNIFLYMSRMLLGDLYYGYVAQLGPPFITIIYAFPVTLSDVHK